MRKLFDYLIISLMLVVSLSACRAQTIEGSWEGKLNLGNRSLKLVFHISPEKIMMDSPDQGVKSIDCETIFLSDDSLNLTVKKLGVAYSGSLKGDSITGTFSQGPVKLPLNLSKSENKKTNRPQTPQPPFPYQTKEISINNVKGGSTLVGTLTIPEDTVSSTPIVVMVTGSGQQNRDEELFEHKPFAVIADYLARNGIASFRYDDRGVGKSTGDILNSTTADFAEDAATVMNWIRENERFGKIGILGHSEGGLIAYMLGAKSDRPDFIISIAGPSIQGKEIIAWQNKVALMKSGVSEPEAEKFRNAIAKVFEYRLKTPECNSIDDEKLEEFYPGYKSSALTINLAAQLKSVLTAKADNYWMMYFLGYDPAKDLKSLKIPAFIIYGEKDTQVPPSLNYDLATQLAHQAKVVTYPGLNHMMQHAITGNVEEYKIIEETFSQEVLADITSFIQSIK
ncbi:MAG: lysophospholipase [Muribaculaceae bacterium]|nr:lysophospholipase [Muribaculaceae bacterium]MDE7369019.1 lysophospholipase [Muribaculaceae bacterium]